MKELYLPLCPPPKQDMGTPDQSSTKYLPLRGPACQSCSADRLAGDIKTANELKYLYPPLRGG